MIKNFIKKFNILVIIAIACALSVAVIEIVYTITQSAGNLVELRVLLAIWSFAAGLLMLLYEIVRIQRDTAYQLAEECDKQNTVLLDQLKKAIQTADEAISMYKKINNQFDTANDIIAKYANKYGNIFIKEKSKNISKKKSKIVS